MKEAGEFNKKVELTINDVVFGVYDNFKCFGREIRLDSFIEEYPEGIDQQYLVGHKSAIIISRDDDKNWIILYGQDLTKIGSYKNEMDVASSVIAVPFKGGDKTDGELVKEAEEALKKTGVFRQTLYGVHGLENGRVRWSIPDPDFYEFRGKWSEYYISWVVKHPEWKDRSEDMKMFEKCCKYISEGSEFKGDILFDYPPRGSKNWSELRTVKYNHEVIDFVYGKFKEMLGL